MRDSELRSWMLKTSNTCARIEERQIAADSHLENVAKSYAEHRDSQTAHGIGAMKWMLRAVMTVVALAIAGAGLMVTIIPKLAAG